MTKATATKVFATISACALCAVLSGGVAYAVTPDDQPTTPESTTATQTLTDAYDNTAKLMEICEA